MAPDIFLSYNREDQAIARRFAEAFEREGFSVWWDATLKSGDAYDQVTENALKTAKAVVVLWSPRSVASRWVRAEATLANRHKTLVPVTIEACERPIMFELTHTAELSHWKGDPKDAAWLAFLSDLRHFVGQDAKPAPPNIQVTPPAPTNVSRRPLIFGGVALAIVIMSVVGFMLSRPQSTPPTNQRIAFFGITASNADPIATLIAAKATDETFKTFNQIGLDTASRVETQNVTSRDQIARARELGALYAVSGEARNDGRTISVSIRMDDAASRATVWEENLIGRETEKASLPYRAAAKATQLTACYIRERARVKVEDEKALKLLARICKARNEGNRLELLDRQREAAVVMPDSALVHAWVANGLYNSRGRGTEAEKSVRRQEFDAALARALALDPSNSLARGMQAIVDIDDGKSFAASEQVLFAAVRADPNDYVTNVNYSAFLNAVGRYRDALQYERATDRLIPLVAGYRTSLARTLAYIGRTREAAALFEETNERLPTPSAWINWMLAAVTLGVSDPSYVLQLAPDTVSGDVRGCLRDFASAKNSTDPKARRSSVDQVNQCLERGTFLGGTALQMLATLGDVDGVFTLAGSPDLSDLRSATGMFLSPSVRAARGDPRFLPLMKTFGVYQYWLDSGTHPDVCDSPEERNFELCASLRADQQKNKTNKEAGKL